GGARHWGTAGWAGPAAGAAPPTRHTNPRSEVVTNRDTLPAVGWGRLGVRGTGSAPTSREERAMRRMLLGVAAVGLMIAVGSGSTLQAACCYFSAKDKDVLQPAQKAFITWDPVDQLETFTVQPKFEGNAQDFGM